MNREDWEPAKYSVICSDHIKECYIKRDGKRVYLKKGALPTRFKGIESHPNMVDDDVSVPSASVDYGISLEIRESNEMEVSSESDRDERVNDNEVEEEIISGEDINEVNTTDYEGNSYKFIQCN